MDRLIKGLFLVLSAYFVLWACAPAATMAPPVPFAEGDKNEIGIGPIYTGVPFDSAPGMFVNEYSGLDGRFWYKHQFGDRFDVGFTLFGGYTSYVGAGFDLRYYFLRKDRIRMGLDLQGGWLWGTVGVPMGFKLTEGVWFFTNPAIETRELGILNFPAGLSLAINDKIQLIPEVGLRVGGANGSYVGWYLSAAFVSRF